MPTPRHVLSLFDLTAEEVSGLLERAARLKETQVSSTSCVGKTLALVFEKPSLRTRVSFEAGMARLGGSSIYLAGSEAGLGSRESVPDFAGVLSQYVDAVVLRTYSHKTIEEFAAHAGCPVINGLSDTAHPCQALSDLFTVRESFGDLAGRTIAFVGDGNNVARSLAIACSMTGVRFVLSAPDGFSFDESFLKLCKEHSHQSELTIEPDPARAVDCADIVYTDVWTSMGQESEQDARRKAFADYQVNNELLEKAPAHAKVMHCLPAHRGEEITSDVMDSPRCIAVQQAGNRMHLQIGLLDWLLSG